MKTHNLLTHGFRGTNPRWQAARCAEWFRKCRARRRRPLVAASCLGHWCLTHGGSWRVSQTAPWSGALAEEVWRPPISLGGGGAWAGTTLTPNTSTMSPAVQAQRAWPRREQGSGQGAAGGRGGGDSRGSSPGVTVSLTLSSVPLPASGQQMRRPECSPSMPVGRSSHTGLPVRGTLAKPQPRPQWRPGPPPPHSHTICWGPAPLP